MEREQEMIRCVIMRGGTSKGIFLRENDLPKDPVLRDRTILAIFGSPDPRQIDGLGGADALTSKVAIIGPPSRSDADVDYTFGQVSITSPVVDYSGNCGNISSAVGPYAIEEGLVRATEPVTVVRIYNTNTKKIIHAEVPVRGGKPVVEGDFAIDGVPGTGAKIMLSFLDVAGAVTGKLLPTGNVRDELRLDDGTRLEVSIVDAANPFVFVRAGDLGIAGSESAQELSAQPSLLERLEEIRSLVAEILGLVADRREATQRSPAVPKISVVAAPKAYKDSAGRDIPQSGIDLLARMMSLQKPHKAYAVTGAVCTAVAAKLPGTVVHDVVSESARSGAQVVIGHPSGTIVTEVETSCENGQFRVARAAIARTARRLMEGYVFVRKARIGGSDALG